MGMGLGVTSKGEELGGGEGRPEPSASLVVLKPLAAFFDWGVQASAGWPVGPVDVGGGESSITIGALLLDGVDW
jgi:hypothetical protein